MPSDHPSLWATTPWDLAFTTAAAMTEAARGFSDRLAHLLVTAEAPPEPLAWTTPNRVRLDLATMRLRDFSTAAAGIPALITAPFALHTAVVADLAPGHSLVERLLQEGIPRLAVIDWKSATAAMRDFSIDTYLAELNVAVDELGPPVDLIGLCQGGWLALVYAARFPAKVRALVLAAAPVDTQRGDSALAALSRATPLMVFRSRGRAGRRADVRARSSATPGRERPASRAPRRMTNWSLMPADDSPAALAALERYAAWDRRVVDLPGPYYLEIVDWLFQQNLLGRGGFPALGRTVALADVRHPVALIAGERRRDLPAATSCSRRPTWLAPGRRRSRASCGRRGHVELFIGARNLADGWPAVARWLASGGKSEPAAIRPLAAPSHLG